MMITKPAIELYPHNQETYERICEMWKTTNRVAAIQATGTGKTFLILKCLFDFADKNKIVLAPSTYILEQLEGKVDELPNTELMTYAKLSRMTDTEIELIDPNLIVLDEFHRCGAEQWGDGIKRLLETFPEAKILGASATPIRYLDGQRDMSDELFDGNVAVNLSLAEAIVRGILPMPKYVSALYTFDEETEKMREKIEKSHNDAESKTELLKKLAKLKSNLDKSKGIPQILKKHFGLKSGKFIVFCKDKNHLYEMKDIVVEWFKKAKIGSSIETHIVLSDLSKSDEEFLRFKNSNKPETIDLLFSVDMLNEGIHLSDVSGVILLRPTISPIIYYQQIGRAIQVSGNICPLIFDFVNNFSNIESRTFIEDLKFVTQNRNMIGSTGGYYDNDLDRLEEFFIVDEVREVMELFDEIDNELHLKGDWDEWYNLLYAYWDECGDSNVSSKTIYRGRRLGIWVKYQRRKYKTNEMTDNERDLLRKLEFIFDCNEAEWNKMYLLLNKYKCENGNCGIRKRDIYYEENLGQWVSTQRKLKKAGNLKPEREVMLDKMDFIWEERDEKWDDMYYKYLKGECDEDWVSIQRQRYKYGKMRGSEIDKLNDAGFIWNEREEMWNKNYVIFKDYFTKNNMKAIPKNLVIEGKNVTNWIVKQRYQFKKGTLKEERIKKLNEINFPWG